MMSPVFFTMLIGMAVTSFTTTATIGLDCLNYPQVSQNGIKCTMTITQDGGNGNHSQNLEVKCFKMDVDVFRIIGEYEVYKIDCTAPYLLDLDYDGFRPTEAVHLSYWKNVAVNGTTTDSYGLSLTVDSILSLYRKYVDLTKYGEGHHNPRGQFLHSHQDPIRYTRTGRYTIRGMWPKHENKNMTFYTFLEEPINEGRISWIENEYTSKIKMASVDNTILLIPCRPSHFLTQDRVQILVQGPRKPLRNFGKNGHPQTSQDGVFDITMKGVWDPTVGFEILPGEIESLFGTVQKLQFRCRHLTPSNEIGEIAEIRWDWTGTGSTPASTASNVQTSLFRQDLLAMKPDGGAMAVTNEVFDTSMDHYVTLRCLLNHKPRLEEGAGFFSVGRHIWAYKEFELQRNFLYPPFSNLSYFIQSGRNDPGSFEFTIDREGPSGIYLCTTGRTYVMKEYTFGRNRRGFPHTAGLAHVSIRLVEPMPEPHENGKLYAGSHFVFICRHNVFMMPPILWFVGKKDGSIIEASRDYSAPGGGFSTLRLTLWNDTTNVSCWSTTYKSDDWRKASMNVSLTDGIPPTITTTRVVHKISRKLQNTQNMKCDAVGDPLPLVWWERVGNVSNTFSRHGHMVPAHATRGTNIYDFGEVTDTTFGDYDCVARNRHGQTRVKFLVTQAPTGKNSVEKEDFSITGLAIGLGFLALFVIATVVIFLYFRARTRRILSDQEIHEFQNGIAAPAPGSVSGVQANEYSIPLALPYLKEYEVAKSQYKIDKNVILGSGAFGLVLKGYVNGGAVAAKTVKPGVEKAYLKSLLSELKILIYLGSNPFLINLVGASTADLRKGTAYVFVEFCELGSLLTYIQDHRPRFLKSADPDYSNQKPVKIDHGNVTMVPMTTTTTEMWRRSSPDSYQPQMYELTTSFASSVTLSFDLKLLHGWAFQIANGMAYLGSKKVIHGDLAARNVLLTSNRIAKITDFGLSRQLFNYTIYRKQSIEPLPWRWMAPEGLTELKFSCQSDVWSYGVTLWELYSLGQIPFPGFNWDDQFMGQIRNGMRLSCPRMMSQALCAKLLTPCWEGEPERRPSFDQICHLLEPILRGDDRALAPSVPERASTQAGPA